MKYPTTLAAAAFAAATLSSVAGIAPSGALAAPAPARHQASGSLAATPGDDDRPGRVLGELSTDGRVPAWADLSAGPGSTGGGSGEGPHWPSASDTLSAGPECIYQCITKGVAYEHGDGVRLVVETSVKAEIILIVCRDDDGDFDCEYHGYNSSGAGVTEFEWVIDPLPAGTYWVTATATDSTGTSHGFGEFTLS